MLAATELPVNYPPRDSPTTVEQLLAAARGQLTRLSPREADAVMRDGAKLVDIRPPACC